MLFARKNTNSLQSHINPTKGVAGYEKNISAE